MTPLQKLPNNVGDLGKISVAIGFEWLPKVQKLPNLVTLQRILTFYIMRSVTLRLTSCFICLDLAALLMLH